jgi:hypothetical protein
MRNDEESLVEILRDLGDEIAYDAFMKRTTEHLESVPGVG